MAGSDVSGTSDGRRRMRLTLAILIGVGLLLSLLPLALSLGLFDGGGRAEVRVGFLPIQSPPSEPDLERAATALFEATHARFRERDDPRLVLIGPTTTSQYRDATESPEVLGSRIGADVVVVGGIRPLPDGRANVAAAVVRVEDGRAIWTEELQMDDPTDASSLTFVTDWLTDRVSRTLQTVRVRP